MIKMNVGCGATPTPGWVNVDNSLTVRLAGLPWPMMLLPPNQRSFVRAVRKNGVRYGLATKLPAADGSADLVYSSHMFEHLDRREARIFLSEVMRILQPGGRLRLAVPDLRRHAERYMREGDADTFVSDTLMGTDRPTTFGGWLHHVVIGARHHLWMYDGASLARLLEAAGFLNAVVLEAGQTTIADTGPLDLHERHEDSVYVEAVRP